MLLAQSRLVEREEQVISHDTLSEGGLAMRATIGSCIFLVLLASNVSAQSPDPPLDNKKLTIHTLVREDIFAGWRAQDMERFARAEKNIDLLLEQRPNSRSELLAWKGGAKLYRAVLAREAGNDEEFQKYFKEAQEHFAEAKTLTPKHPAVAAVVGGSYVMFADRLPEEARAAAWNESYDNYQLLWSVQAPLLEKLPLHIRGELLAGLAQSAQRTGRTKELDEYLDKMIAVLPDSGYGRMAEQWKKDPQSAATSNISCKSCHAEGRLSARLAGKGD
jgi:tetratricopeptide (TPR) repeat protein